MAYPKRLALQIYKIEDYAFKLYEEGLITSFKAYVPKKYSYVEVLKGVGGDGTNIGWLNKIYERICDFAQDARLKMIPLQMNMGATHTLLEAINAIHGGNKS